MICYNVARRFFPMKAEADRYRVDNKMRPSALTRLDVRTREDLADILNSVAAEEHPDLSAYVPAETAKAEEEEPPILAAIAAAERLQHHDPDDDDIPAFLKA